MPRLGLAPAMVKCLARSPLESPAQVGTSAAFYTVPKYIFFWWPETAEEQSV